MKLNIKIKKVALIIYCVLMTTSVLAGPLPPPTTCPSNDQVKQSASKLDEAYPLGGHYAVASSQPALYASHHDWFINVAPVLEGTPKAAIAKAQQTITTITEGTDKPIAKESWYYCQYITKDSFVQAITSENNVNVSKSLIIKLSH